MNIFLSYLDPASGAAFIQAIIAAIATSLVFLKLYWFKVVDFFRPSNTQSNSQNTNENIEK